MRQMGETAARMLLNRLTGEDPLPGRPGPVAPTGPYSPSGGSPYSPSAAVLPTSIVVRRSTAGV
jgi:hypothetical protein